MMFYLTVIIIKDIAVGHNEKLENTILAAEAEHELTAKDQFFEIVTRDEMNDYHYIFTLVDVGPSLIISFRALSPGVFIIILS